MSHIIDPSHRNPPANRRTVGDQFSTTQPSVAQHLGHQTKPTKSKINTKSPEYIANYKEMLEMVDQLNERLQEATFQGADRLLALHHKRGSILGTTPAQMFSCTLSLSIWPCLIFCEPRSCESHIPTESFSFSTVTSIARDRLELLLDDDSPFMELCPLAGYGQDDMTIGGSQVAGIGLVW